VLTPDGKKRREEYLGDYTGGIASKPGQDVVNYSENVDKKSPCVVGKIERGTRIARMRTRRGEWTRDKPSHEAESGGALKNWEDEGGEARKTFFAGVNGLERRKGMRKFLAL